MQFTTDLVGNVVISALASALIALAVYFWRSAMLRERLDLWLATTIPQRHGASTVKSQLARVQALLLRRIVADQSPSGLHAGEYGRTASLEAEKKFQPGKENMQAKARIYLTMWPVRVFAARNLAPASTRFALRRVERLFTQHRINVFEAVNEGLPPQPQPPLISYRHTIGGALLLYDGQGPSPTVRDVLSAMITSNWQNEDGGWAYCDRKYTKSDLWASLYAIRLLDAASSDERLTEQQRAACSARVSGTLRYFADEWRERGWAYGAVNTEENAILMLVELGPTLQRRAPELLANVLSRVQTWQTPFGLLTEEYRASLPEKLGPLAACARASYALMRSGEPERLWRPTYDEALSRLDEQASSADLAFLLDLTCSLLSMRARPAAPVERAAA